MAGKVTVEAAGITSAGSGTRRARSAAVKASVTASHRGAVSPYTSTEAPSTVATHRGGPPQAATREATAARMRVRMEW